MGAFWPPSSPSRYVSSDAFSQAKVLSVPGKRELTVPAREAPPTVETDLMELDMYFVGLIITLKNLLNWVLFHVGAVLSMLVKIDDYDDDYALDDDDDDL